MPTSPHRRVPRDTSAKRRRSWGATGIGGAGWSAHGLTGYDARRVLRENRDCAQSLFLKYSWNSGMPPGLTTLNFKT